MDSIASNIAEGCGAASNKDFARFLDNSIKSANEAEHHFLCARDFKLFSHEKWQRYNDEVVEIRKMTIGYRKRVLSDD